MEKINVEELLKNCPKGMELDCVLFDGVVFDEIDDDEYCGCPIVIKTREGETWNLTSTGCWDDSPSAKCVIFPKGKTTWEGFQRPFVDGDIVITDNNEHAFIYSGENDICWECYCGVYCGTRNICINSKKWSDKKRKLRLATEEEKEKLFQVIKDNGYKWNVETKTLEKLIEPIFKIGNRIKYKNGVEQGVIESITDDTYDIAVTNNTGIRVSIASQDEWELVPNKFDVSTLIPFESRVLVRDSDIGIWLPEFFGCLCDDNDYPYMIVGGTRWKCCIPYEGNEHLLGTTDSCADFYKTWED